MTLKKQTIQTSDAPAAIGTYSQAVQVAGLVFLSGQIPLIPESMELIEGDITAQTEQVFRNLAAVTNAAGGSLNDIAKLTVYLTDLAHFPIVNTVMAQFFDTPYPARAAIGVSQLPRSAQVEVEAIMVAPGGDR